MPTPVRRVVVSDYEGISTNRVVNDTQFASRQIRDAVAVPQIPRLSDPIPSVVNQHDPSYQTRSNERTKSWCRDICNKIDLSKCSRFFKNCCRVASQREYHDSSSSTVSVGMLVFKLACLAYSYHTVHNIYEQYTHTQDTHIESELSEVIWETLTACFRYTSDFFINGAGTAATAYTLYQILIYGNAVLMYVWPIVQKIWKTITAIPSAIQGGLKAIDRYMNYGFYYTLAQRILDVGFSAVASWIPASFIQDAIHSFPKVFLLPGKVISPQGYTALAVATTLYSAVSFSYKSDFVGRVYMPAKLIEKLGVFGIIAMMGIFQFASPPMKSDVLFDNTNKNIVQIHNELQLYLQVPPSVDRTTIESATRTIADTSNLQSAFCEPTEVRKCYNDMVLVYDAISSARYSPTYWSLDVFRVPLKIGASCWSMKFYDNDISNQIACATSTTVTTVTTFLPRFVRSAGEDAFVGIKNLATKMIKSVTNVVNFILETISNIATAIKDYTYSKWSEALSAIYKIYTWVKTTMGNTPIIGDSISSFLALFSSDADTSDLSLQEIDSEETLIKQEVAPIQTKEDLYKSFQDVIIQSANLAVMRDSINTLYTVGDGRVSFDTKALDESCESVIERFAEISKKIEERIRIDVIVPTELEAKLNSNTELKELVHSILRSKNGRTGFNDILSKAQNQGLDDEKLILKMNDIPKSSVINLINEVTKAGLRDTFKITEADEKLAPDSTYIYDVNKFCVTTIDVTTKMIGPDPSRTNFAKPEDMITSLQGAVSFIISSRAEENFSFLDKTFAERIKNTNATTIEKYRALEIVTSSYVKPALDKFTSFVNVYDREEYATSNMKTKTIPGVVKTMLTHIRELRKPLMQFQSAYLITNSNTIQNIAFTEEYQNLRSVMTKDTTDILTKKLDDAKHIFKLLIRVIGNGGNKLIDLLTRYYKAATNTTQNETTAVQYGKILPAVNQLFKATIAELFFFVKLVGSSVKDVVEEYTANSNKDNEGPFSAGKCMNDIKDADSGVFQGVNPVPDAKETANVIHNLFEEEIKSAKDTLFKRTKSVFNTILKSVDGFCRILSNAQQAIGKAEIPVSDKTSKGDIDFSKPLGSTSQIRILTVDAINKNFYDTLVCDDCGAECKEEKTFVCAWCPFANTFCTKEHILKHLYHDHRFRYETDVNPFVIEMTKSAITFNLLIRLNLLTTARRMPYLFKKFFHRRGDYYIYDGKYPKATIKRYAKGDVNDPRDENIAMAINEWIKSLEAKASTKKIDVTIQEPMKSKYVSTINTNYGFRSAGLAVSAPSAAAAADVASNL